MCQEHERQGTAGGSHVLPHCGHDGDGHRQESGALEVGEPGTIGSVVNDQRRDSVSEVAERGAT